MEKKITYWQIITYIIYAIVIIFAFLAISAKLNIGGIRLLVVKSGSMEPTIRTGSMVITKSQADYVVNDIVTYRDRDKPDETITHRVVGEENQGNIKLFTTQGDANGSPDSAKVLPDQVIGKVRIQIPYFGYAVAFSRTSLGLIILIVIPATIIIYDEINKIILEIKERKAKPRRAGSPDSK